MIFFIGFIITIVVGLYVCKGTKGVKIDSKPKEKELDLSKPEDYYKMMLYTGGKRRK